MKTAECKQLSRTICDLSALPVIQLDGAALLEDFFVAMAQQANDQLQAEENPESMRTAVSIVSTIPEGVILRNYVRMHCKTLCSEY